MSRQQPPPFVRKTSAPWDRLRPIKQDPLEAMGFVSKGDNRLLDPKAQESFYHKIVERYMQFCTRHKKDLNTAFASLSVGNNTASSSDLTRNLPVMNTDVARGRGVPSTSKGLSSSKWASASAPPPAVVAPSTSPATELSTILMALRKLREGLLATSAATGSPVFSQRVHVFNIRVGILALHPPSYHPSLSYLLRSLHKKNHPLPDSELREMTTYMILDLALRQNDLVAAYALRFNSRRHFGYENRSVNEILQAAVNNDWVSFWRVRRSVDGYVRALMHWHTDHMRRAVLKAFGRAYLKVDSKWLLESASDNEMNWTDLITQEAVGWVVEDDSIIIRKPKIKP